MAKIRVSVPSLLRSAIGGGAEVELEATTFEHALERLLELHPRLRPHLYDDAGELREHVNLFLGDSEARWLDSWSQPLRDGDTITILQAVSGG